MLDCDGPFPPFPHVLSLSQTRSSNLKHQQDRRQIFSKEAAGLGTAGGLFPPLSAPEGTGRHAAVGGISAAAGASGAMVIDMGGTAGSGGSFEVMGSGPSHQAQSSMLVTPNYNQDRLNAVHSVETSIRDLANIFGELNTMVMEQGETIRRIDENVEETVMHVDAGHSELLKYWGAVSSNRGLVMKIFAILILFIIIFGVFVA